MKVQAVGGQQLQERPLRPGHGAVEGPAGGYHRGLGGFPRKPHHLFGHGHCVSTFILLTKIILLDSLRKETI